MIFGSAMAGDDHKCSSDAAKKKCAPGCFMSKLVKADENDEAKICDHAKMADCTGKCTHLTLNIKGMTCTGCENKIKTALTDCEGVVCVKTVDHQKGSAMLCIDDKKIESKKVLTVVSELGYETSLVSAEVCTHAEADQSEKKTETKKCPYSGK
jgi:copper chaperone CopZ